jgi:hypothetical protein
LYSVTGLKDLRCLILLINRHATVRKYVLRKRYGSIRLTLLNVVDAKERKAAMQALPLYL